MQSNTDIMQSPELSITKKTKKIHPEEKSNFFFHIPFCWEIPIILKYFKKHFDEEDLFAPLQIHDSKRLGDKLFTLWDEQISFRENPSLLRALIKMFGVQLMFYGLLYIPVYLSIAFFLPRIFHKLMEYFTPNQTEIVRTQAYLFGTAFILLNLLRVPVMHLLQWKMYNIGMKIRIACSSLIYKKCLTLTKSSFENITMGQIINLLSSDVDRFSFVFIDMYHIEVAFLECIVVGYYLDFTFGHSTLAGFGIILIYLTIQCILSTQMFESLRKTVLKTDYRIRLINDIICGIKVIKLYNWETSFIKLIDTARKSEMKDLQIYLTLFFSSCSFKFYLTKIITFSCILTAILSKVSFTPQYIFVLIIIVEHLKRSLILHLPHSLRMIQEIKFSVQRIQKFLLADVIHHRHFVARSRSKKFRNSLILKSQIHFEEKSLGIYLKNISVKWKSSQPDVLSDVTLNALTGELIGIFGASGSGKSSLLQAILKEVILTKGTLEVIGRISYASQEPWMFSASIKQNILFGEEIDEEKYMKVIKICGLEQDLSLLTYGDNTLVGDRGIMLSGGQKARISLARAVYREADIYLLDDPLSAVDTRVATLIMQQCILEHLKNKCVVFVTHQIHFLQEADRIYNLKGGKLILNDNSKHIKIKENTNRNNLGSQEIVFKQNALPDTIQEHRSTTNKKNYKSYCNASGNPVILFLILLLGVINQVISISSDYLLMFVVNLGPNQTEIFTINHLLYLYSGLTLSLTLIMYVFMWIFIKFCHNSSINLHKIMSYKVVNSSIIFFENHSSGRILNRFSKDIGAVDHIIPNCLFDLLRIVFQFIGVIVLISILNYWMIIPSLALIVIFYCYSIVYTPLNKDVRRTEAIARSSIFSHVVASLQGLATIRAFGAQKILEEEFQSHYNLHSSAAYLFTCLHTTLGFWVDGTCTIYLAVVLSSLLFIQYESISAATFGLSITQSLSLLTVMQWSMKVWSDLDSHITSVERVVEYSELVPELDEGTNIPSKSWPQSGDITFESVSMRYSLKTHLVITNVSLHINAGEKIGIVGRTGAGKTSLVSALFRLYHFDGTITIDGVDTKSVPLSTLRSKMSVIPQDPILFVGTVRKNLDPFDEFTHTQLSKALEDVNLKGMIDLDNEVSDGGNNFSMGEKQLVCLLRAVLRKSKIVVLDEATANLDTETDELIQATIRTKFRDSTVLTVAHRLNTVMDSDKILVLDAGCVVEFDSPKKLLQNPNGLFYSYAKYNNKN